MKNLKFIIYLFIFLSATLNAQKPTIDSVTKLYVATFQRAPDSAGLEYWVYDSGLSLEGIASSFFDQPETKELYPNNYSTIDFIVSVYENLFNREPENEGLTYWYNELESGNIEKSAFILAVMNGAIDTELGKDATILENKRKVGEYFANMGINDIDLAYYVMKDIDDTQESVESSIDYISKYKNSSENRPPEEDEDKKETTPPDGNKEQTSDTSKSSNNDDTTKDTSTVSKTISGWEKTESTAFNYLNQIRKSLGLNVLKPNSNLHTAAKNHAIFLVENNIFSHYENSSYSYYTGDNPTQRGEYAGYFSSVFENISMDYNIDPTGSVDKLMSAIYHRIGFLSFDIDEIGIGIRSKDWTAYVYDMGNSNINRICADGGSYSGGGYYYGICNDGSIKIDTDVYIKAKNINPAKKYVVYPKGDTKIGIFSNETPYPIPGYSYSGNPASISFNSSLVDCSNIVMTSFTLLDESTNQKMDIIATLTKSSDPNGKFTDCDFAIFPKDAEKFNHTYQATFEYEDATGVHTLNWRFNIVAPTDDTDAILEIEPNKNSYQFNIDSNRYYYIYFEPNKEYPSISNISYSYNIDKSEFEISYYNSNILLLKTTTSKSGGYITLKANGKEIRFDIK